MSTENVVLLATAFAVAIVYFALTRPVSRLLASGFARPGVARLGMAALGVAGVVAAALLTDATSHAEMRAKHPTSVCSRTQSAKTARC